MVPQAMKYIACDVLAQWIALVANIAIMAELDTGEIVASLRAEITLRVHASAVDRVMEYCAFDRFTPDGDEYYLVRFPFIDREYYYDRLLSFGDRCECVAPARVREKLRQRIRRLAEMYQ